MKHPSIDRAIGALAGLLRELSLPASFLSPLLAHAEAVMRDADRLGLVSAADIGHVVPRHTADSLLFALARAPVPGESWADIGSGAGFPGMPLAICYPGSTFTLIEPQKRRAGFLEMTIDELGLANVRVVAGRAETISPGFDVVVARALAEPAVALEMCARLASPGGDVVIAVGETAEKPQDVSDLDLRRPGVDSPGRLFMMSRPRKGA